MDDRQHALAVELINVLTEHPTQEYDLAELKPYMTPKQQMFIDLVEKLREMQALLEEM